MSTCLFSYQKWGKEQHVEKVPIKGVYHFLFLFLQDVKYLK